MSRYIDAKDMEQRVRYGSHVIHWMPLPDQPKGDKA